MWLSWLARLVFSSNLKNKFALKSFKKRSKDSWCTIFFKNSSMSVGYNDLNNLEKIIKKLRYSCNYNGSKKI